MRLFVSIKLPSDEPVLYVGVYVLKWGRFDHPTIAFVDATDDQVLEEARRITACRESALTSDQKE